MESLKVPVHVEVELSPNSLLSHEQVEDVLREQLKAKVPIFREEDIEVSLSNSDRQWKDILRVSICDLGDQEVSFWKAELIFHVYKCLEGDPEKDYIDGEDDLPACDQWELPNKALDRLWEVIVVDDRIKRDILGYATSAMIFTSAMIDPDIISWNRMMLLHGPPGSGKTTLCKAIAQKLYIRNKCEYDNGFLLEINSHSLFSKWFSESGKLVMKLFDHINDIADDEKSFVCVLIDEVESISSCRNSSMSTNEPGDAVRVVNAVLTSLDALKRRSNVLVLCTSNMEDAIDPAFRDRIDMSFFLGAPSTQARYKILQSCLHELSAKNVISPQIKIANSVDGTANITQHAQVEGNHLEKWAKTGDSPFDNSRGNVDMNESVELKLQEIAQQCEGYSGRSLRKLPLRAHAMFLQRKKVTVMQFLDAIDATIKQETSNLTQM